MNGSSPNLVIQVYMSRIINQITQSSKYVQLRWIVMSLFNSWLLARVLHYQKISTPMSCFTNALPV